MLNSRLFCLKFLQHKKVRGRLNLLNLFMFGVFKKRKKAKECHCYYI